MIQFSIDKFYCSVSLWVKAEWLEKDCHVLLKWFDCNLSSVISEAFRVCQNWSDSLNHKHITIFQHCVWLKGHILFVWCTTCTCNSFITFKIFFQLPGFQYARCIFCHCINTEQWSGPFLNVQGPTVAELQQKIDPTLWKPLGWEDLKNLNPV